MQPYISSLFHATPSTHESATFIQRIVDNIILPIKIMLATKDVMARKQSIMAELDITPYSSFVDHWRHGLVLVSNFFGF
jgi:hypothetical protein